MRNEMWTFLCIGFLSFTLDAQDVTFTATTNAKQVATQGIFQVTFTLENAQGQDFQPPDFKGYDYVSGPAQSRSTSIINGVMTQSLSYTYSLMRMKPGIYTIGPASIRVGSKTLTTRPLTVEVVQGKPNTPGADPAASHDVFLRAIVSSNVAYPGQQVRLDYKVYTTVNVRNYNTLSEDEYAQFYYRYVQDFNNRAQLEVVNGIQYTVQTIKSLALFPKQSGNFGIAPMVASLGVAVKGERPSLLFGTHTIPVTVASDSVIVKVLPLPSGAPSQFSGAVGKYTMTAQINKHRLTTDDALVLTLDIIGNGDPKRWSPPDLSGLQTEYELYDPKILIDESIDEHGAFRHRRMIEYLMIPRRAGERTLQVDFAYFDPDSGTYRTISTPLFEIAVVQGTRTAKGDQVFSGDAESKELHGLKPMRAGSRGVFLFTPLYFTLLLLPLVGLAAVWWMKRKEDLFEALDPIEKKRRRARKLAERHLMEAHQNLTGTDRIFYDSLSRALFSYLSAKLNIPTSELTKANISAHLDRLNLPVELREEVINILLTSEQVLYAGVSSNADRTFMYDRAVAMIERVEGIG
ncbi:MAG TPA: BatD family protein [Saprospiraceae bacterium]|nr:BatD family protein [Saprospiraceae bacterium]